MQGQQISTLNPSQLQQIDWMQGGANQGINIALQN
jgi:hypothetical protein